MDIGANIGFYTLKFANQVGNEGMVVAFEPHPKTFEKLTKLIFNKNVIFKNLGFSNSKGILRFTDKKDHTTNKIVTTDYDDNAIEVTIETIDDIIKNQDLEVPRIVKIDVEGHELKVLEGMSNTLKNQKLEKILLEIHHEALEDIGIKDGAKSAQNILQLNGFVCKWLDPSHILASR